jgi:ATP-binding cassette, subfamily B, bacterial PglK
MSNNLSKLKNILGKGNSKKILLLIPFFIIAALLETVSIGLIMPLISILTDDSLVTEYLTQIDFLNDLSLKGVQVVILGVFLFTYLIKSLYVILFFYHTEKLLTSIRLELHDRMFSSYLEAGYEYHLKHNRSELKRNIDEIGVIFQSYLSPLVMLVVEVAVLFGIVLMLMLSNAQVTFISIASIGALSFLIYYYVKPMLNKMGLERVDASEKINRHLYQGLGAIKEVKVLQKEGYFSSQFRKYMGKFLRLNLMNSVYNIASSVIIESVFITGLVVLLFLLLQSSSQQLMLPMIALFGLASIRLLQSVKKIMMYGNQLSYSASSLSLVSAELDNIGCIRASDSPKIRRTAKLNFVNDIEFKGVSYKYSSLDRKVLNNINIGFDKNTCTAIVGHSGSGKTTLVNVFLNLLSASEGAFLIDGSKYNDLSMLGGNIGYVPQSVYVTDDTIESNVAFGVERDKINHDRVMTSLRLSHLHDFVSTLPNGINTYLGEDGARLSGGQKQRLGIARALYNDPDIIVFDEMTASLDSVTEEKIMSEIFEMKKSKTIVIITHKINTINTCNKIYVLDGGQVVDSGTYNELIVSSAKFKNLASVHNYN